ncbi:MAG: glycosyltransferase family 4 protein [Ruminococcaceae bacterium]|nr:glycosyltransferase family 4 protein [Oscillospiraceae bacterium]
MNVLFLTTGRMKSIEAYSLYPDLLRQFRAHGHTVYVVSQREKNTGLPTELKDDHGAHMLYVRIGNLTGCGRIEKGVTTLQIEGQYKKAIKKYFPGVHFDLVLYSTPPITLVGVVEYIKKRDQAQTYLLLKDIFPQNAVDLGMMAQNGLKGLLYRYFRRKEEHLYAVSDHIGCMSSANVNYVLEHNPKISPDTISVCPNCIEPRDMSLSPTAKREMRDRYGIPQDRKVFLYGGNFGKPQGISFLIECLRNQKKSKAFFLLIGGGTEYHKVETFIKSEPQGNVKLLKHIPKDDYDRMVAACDVGMIFLDHRFTIPNFPSRLLPYIQAGLPVLACTDPNTDVGKVITDGGFGWWCESNDVERFSSLIQTIVLQDTTGMSARAKNYLWEHYHVAKAYQSIVTALRIE